jgi:hypothetical protein
MRERVFVSAAGVRAPAVRTAADLAELVRGDRPSPLELFTVGGEEIRLGEQIPMDRASPFYPSRSNEKIMRKEVIAAAVNVCELLAEAGLPGGLRVDVPLFVASGVTLERQVGDVDWFAKAFEAVRASAGGAERNRRLSHVTPPLLALRTLTNATSSFIAEQTGVTGNNTTFGNTSQAGFHALREGFDAVASRAVPMALVGGASRGGIASYLTFRNFFEDPADWRESIATAFLLLESGTSLGVRAGKALCEVVELAGTTRPPALVNAAPDTPFEEFASRGATASLAVYSGAFCGREERKLRAAAAAAWPRAESLFESLGNGGAANLFLGIAVGASLLGGAGVADCLDRDPYGRDSFVRLRAVAA